MAGFDYLTLQWEITDKIGAIFDKSETKKYII